MSKIVFLGNSGVGKTSILRNLKSGKFEFTDKSTIGCEFFAKIVHNNGIDKKLLLWDTAGQEVFRSFTQNFLRGAKIVVIVYDITSENTINDIHIWIKETKKSLNSKIIIVGNKADMNTTIDYHLKTQDIKNQYKDSDINLYHKAISAKDNEEVIDFFNYIGNQLEDKTQQVSISNNVDLLGKKNSYSCCY